MQWRTASQEMPRDGSEVPGQNYGTGYSQVQATRKQNDDKTRSNRGRGAGREGI